MKNKELTEYALLCGIGTYVYIAFVVLLMKQGEHLAGKVEGGILGPIAFLLLFVVSATITSSLVFGKPVMLYIDGHKKDAVKLFLGTALVLILALLTTFSVLILRAF